MVYSPKMAEERAGDTGQSHSFRRASLALRPTHKGAYNDEILDRKAYTGDYHKKTEGVDGTMTFGGHDKFTQSTVGSYKGYTVLYACEQLEEVLKEIRETERAMGRDYRRAGIGFPNNLAKIIQYLYDAAGEM